MKFDYKSYSNHLESENERLNAIIDEVEKINEDQLTEIFMLNLENKELKERIKNADEFCDRYMGVKLELFDMYKLLNKIREILGADDNEET